MPKYTLALPFVALVVFPLLLSSFENYLSGRADLAEGLANIQARLEFFQDQVLDDASALERAQVLEAGTELFLRNPIVGAGAGATELVVATGKYTQPACKAWRRVWCLWDSHLDLAGRYPLDRPPLSRQKPSGGHGCRVRLSIDVYSQHV